MNNTNFTKPNSTMGDLQFDKHVEKDAVPTPSQEIEKSLTSYNYMSVYDIVKDYYPEDLQKFVEEPSDLKDEYEYPRTGTDPGLVVIFNHERFDYLDLRKGSRRDVNELIQALGRVGYNIEKKYIYNDLTRKEIISELRELSEKDYTQRNCLIVVFLTHGEDSNKLHVRDGFITTTEVWEKFSNCPTLKTKPKLFIFQACKGNNSSYAVAEDEQNDLVNLIPADTFTIPFAPDMLIVYAAVEGNYSFRHKLKGSWFIQELCKNILAYGRREDVVSIVTRTTKCVANSYFLVEEEVSNYVQKQMPLFISTLTKRFYLTRSKERNLFLDFIRQHNAVAETVYQLQEKVDVVYDHYLKEKTSAKAKTNAK